MNALKKVISMSEKERSKQRVGSFFNGLEQGTESLTDEAFTRLERKIMEKRGRAAAYVAVGPIDTAQPCNSRSSCSEISFDVHVYMEGNTQGWVEPEPGQLKPSSAGTGQLESPSTRTGFEKPGQQCIMVDGTNHCRRLFARRREFEFGEDFFFPGRTRYRFALRQGVGQRRKHAI